ncbi:hypothetical protein SAMN04487939_11057 [Lysobacter sp. yr284]|uniref:hypothetical protein n=1 Tax=Lysobacter TaxID=68 RepID=UPI000897DFC6|nr:hypothetical protein [Lysobacter sp. yr284]SDY96176.1 hypothetical protein SAMN04487939_11057 [Lysobacter sp. yr284]
MRTTALAFALLIAATAAFSAPSFAREKSYQACSPPFSGPPFCQPPLSQGELSSGTDRRATTKAPTQAPRSAPQPSTAKK